MVVLNQFIEFIKFVQLIEFVRFVLVVHNQFLIQLIVQFIIQLQLFRRGCGQSWFHRTQLSMQLHAARYQRV